MYSLNDRSLLLNQIAEFMQSCACFEGLLLIGSGAVGFTDIYSDIDLMAGCFDAASVMEAAEQLDDFFISYDACHIERRKWTNTALGFSAYFKNGLSTDVSFMPTDEIPLRSSQYRILFSKSERFHNQLEKEFSLIKDQSNQLDNNIHHRFITELRYAEIAALRGNFVFSEIALGNARKILLTVEAKNENKKLHQFKAFNTLCSDFLRNLENTYPKTKNVISFQDAASHLLEMYLTSVQKCEGLEFDQSLLEMLGKFT